MCRIVRITISIVSISIEDERGNLLCTLIGQLAREQLVLGELSSVPGREEDVPRDLVSAMFW